MTPEQERELLELAAQAMGYKLSPLQKRVGHRDEPTVLHGFGLVTQDGWDWINGAVFWNPLTSPGDCAEMEDALMLNISWDKESVRVNDHLYECDGAAAWFYEHNNDRGAARRMASVRVAAEIGRRMNNAKF